MLSYEEILEYWFFVSLPHGISLEEFESETALKDRILSGNIVSTMSQTVYRKAQALFGIDLDNTAQCLSVLDKCITPEAAHFWMKDSDPDDPRNFFLITVSEFAVHLGNVLIPVVKGAWHYARTPNFFRSTVRVGNIEVSVFDAIIKKCSRDFGNQSLNEKFAAYLNVIQTNKTNTPLNT